MALNTQQLESIADSALDFHFDRGKVHQQTIQEKPLLKKLESSMKTFPGGKGDIKLGVKGDYGHPKNRTTGADVVTPVGGSDSVKGFTHDDQLKFYTPANNRRVNYPWREHHLGITLSYTELKIDGLSVVDTNGNRAPSSHSDRELTVLAGIFESALEDFSEKYARDMNTLYWGDGTADTKALAGMRALITDNPASGTKGGLDTSVVTWWRNRARTTASGGTITSSPTNGGALLQELQKQWRQLRRYGGRPDCFFAGSDFIDAMEVEIRANGNYSETGFTKNQDGSMGEMRFKGVPVIYDPTLDDLTLAKRAYVWDSRDIFLMGMEGEWMRRHSPARPHDYMVLYRSITSTGQLVARRLNSAGVYDIA